MASEMYSKLLNEAAILVPNEHRLNVLNEGIFTKRESNKYIKDVEKIYKDPEFNDLPIKTKEDAKKFVDKYGEFLDNMTTAARDDLSDAKKVSLKDAALTAGAAGVTGIVGAIGGMIVGGITRVPASILGGVGAYIGALTGLVGSGGVAVVKTLKDKQNLEMIKDCLLSARRRLNEVRSMTTNKETLDKIDIILNKIKSFEDKYAIIKKELKD